MDLHTPPFRRPGEPEDGEPLRAIDWAGLVARLSAERDLRRELSAEVGVLGAGASFAAGAAGALNKADEAAVNPDALALRKSVAGTTAPDAAQTPTPRSEA